MSDVHVQECYICSLLAQFSTDVSLWFCCLTTHILLSEAEKSQFWTVSSLELAEQEAAAWIHLLSRTEKRWKGTQRLYFPVKPTKVKSLNVKKKEQLDLEHNVSCLEKCHNPFQKYIWTAW